MIAEYWHKMKKDKRVVVINDDGKFEALIAFSICNDHKPYEAKGTWEYMRHDSRGKICYVEKLISLGWSKKLRKALESFIVEHYPTFEVAIWHRPTNRYDRKVIYRRRVYA